MPLLNNIFMGARGPAPTPTPLRIIRGNPSHRPLPKNEPQPRDVAPRCPEHVKAIPEAHKEWKRLLPILRRMKILTEADGMLIANYCLVHADMLWNLEQVQKLNAASKNKVSGVVIATKNGYLAPNQFYLNVQNAIERLLKLGKEMGLSPSARTRIMASGKEEKQPDDPWQQL